MDTYEQMLMNEINLLWMLDSMGFWIGLILVGYAMFQYLLPFLLMKTLVQPERDTQSSPTSRRKKAILNFGFILCVVGLVLILIGFGDAEMTISGFGLEVEGAETGMVILILGLFALFWTTRKKGD